MSSTEQILAIARWSVYLTLFVAAIAILGWFLKWSFRFRLVGATGFMVVLTAGLYALSLGLYTRPSIPGAVPFSLVYDTGASHTVIAVPPTITPTQLEATLRQAAFDLYSTGRLSQGQSKLTVQARTVVHPEPGVSQIVYLGQSQRALFPREANQVTVNIDQAQFAQLPHPIGQDDGIQ